MNLRAHISLAVGAALPVAGLLVSTTGRSFHLSQSRFGDVTKILSETLHFPLMVSSGFIFEDGEQVLTSLQKPLGLILEEAETTEGMPSVFVAEVSPGSSGASAGLKTGDIVVAVQNIDIRGQNLEYVMSAIQKAPKVLNIRVQREMI